MSRIRVVATLIERALGEIALDEEVRQVENKCRQEHENERSGTGEDEPKSVSTIATTTKPAE
jgi:hypothetical protein